MSAARAAVPSTTSLSPHANRSKSRRRESSRIYATLHERTRIERQVSNNSMRTGAHSTFKPRGMATADLFGQRSKVTRTADLCRMWVGGEMSFRRLVTVKPKTRNRKKTAKKGR